MKIWPLGVGGWIPAFGRQTNSTLIEHKNRLIIVDAGTGISNLFGYDMLLNKYEGVDLILTHYHMDHLMGLFFLPKFLGDKKLTIWGPGKSIYNESCQSIIKRHLDQPFGTTGAETLAEHVVINDYDKAGFQIGDVQVGVIPQVHTLPSFGITLDDKLHIATDTDVNPEVFKLKVDFLMHECWAKTDEDAKEHASMEGILKAYKAHEKESSLKGIGIIHRNPSYCDTEYANWIESPVIVLHENQLIEI